MANKTVVNVDYERIKQSANILAEVSPIESYPAYENVDSESTNLYALIEIELPKLNNLHDNFLSDVLSKQKNLQLYRGLTNTNNEYRDIIDNSSKIATVWQDKEMTHSDISNSFSEIDKLLGLTGDKSLSEMYSSTNIDSLEFHTNAAEIKGFITSGNISNYCSSEYKNRDEWKVALVLGFMNQGYSKSEALDLAYLTMAEDEIKATGAESQALALSTITELKGKYKVVPPSEETQTSQEATDTTTYSYSGSNSSPKIQYRTATVSKAPTIVQSTPVQNVTEQVENSQTQNAPEQVENSIQNTTEQVGKKPPAVNKDPVIVEEESPVTETPNKNNTPTVGETGNSVVSKPSINNQTNIGNNSSVETTPNNNATGNNNSYSSNSTGGNYNSGHATTPITNSGGLNENAATTTPSAPESDAGIIDKSGETLDVISIDKATTPTSASTSNDGGSVVPTILGVGIAGAAAVAGAKYIHDKKQKQNNYEEESETDNDFSYNDDYVTNQEQAEPMEKYKAGSQNDLVLEAAPADLKIEDDDLEIPGKQEELE